ncbi:MAG TPA: hypothetical protein VHU88_02765 [Sporichthyaceae bacterium]|jgi:mRNA interferase RelE/StbE|nr:hypothetical protein [Sporichthyaceae bacterium]
MTRQVIWEEQAVSQAAGFSMTRRVCGQHSMPSDGSPMIPVRPSFPYGSPDRRRLRIGRYRVMYDITGELVSVWRIARLADED